MNLDHEMRDASANHDTIMGYSVATLQQRCRFMWSEEQNLIFQNYVSNHKIRKEAVKNLDLDSLYSLLGFDIYHGVTNEDGIQIVSIIRPKVIDKLHRIISKMRVDERYFKALVTMNTKLTRFSGNPISSTPASPSAGLRSKQRSKPPYYSVDSASSQRSVISFCHYPLLLTQALVLLPCDIHHRL